MDVTLPVDLEEFVKAAVASGRYQSASEVLVAALRMLRGPKIEPLHPRVDSSLAALSRGEGEDGEAYVETPEGELEESQEDERPVRL